MKLPRSINGRDLANVLIRRFNYTEDHQTGSHIILKTSTSSSQTLPIPSHKPLKTGTLAAILKLVADHRGIKREAILQWL